METKKLTSELYEKYHGLEFGEAGYEFKKNKKKDVSFTEELDRLEEQDKGKPEDIKEMEKEIIRISEEAHKYMGLIEEKQVEKMYVPQLIETEARVKGALQNYSSLNRKYFDKTKVIHPNYAKFVQCLSSVLKKVRDEIKVRREEMGYHDDGGF